MAAQIRVPFRISNAGYVDSTTSMNERIAMNVLSAIATRLGERVMLGEYGSTVPDHSFGNINPAYAVSSEQLIEEEASKALAAYYPLVRVTDVRVEQIATSLGEYRVTIEYTLDTDSVDRTATVTVARDLLTGN